MRWLSQLTIAQCSVEKYRLEGFLWFAAVSLPVESFSLMRLFGLCPKQLSQASIVLTIELPFEGWLTFEGGCLGLF